MQKGFSIIELTIVIGILAILAVISSQSVILSLTGARKSESTIKVRENLEYATTVVERQLRNAKSISPCSGSGTRNIQYLDVTGRSTSFSCDINQGYIASGSARITGSGVDVTDCSFTCTPSSFGVPQSVDVNFTAEASGAGGAERSPVTISTKVYLRSY